MKKQHIEELVSELRTMGFEGKWGSQLKWHMAANPSGFIVRPKLFLGSDKIDYDVHFERKPKQAAEHVISGYEAMLRKEKLIPHLTINEIDTTDLENRIKKVKWHDDYFSENHKDDRYHDEGNKKLDEEVIKILRDVGRLADRSEAGKFVQQLLHQKYWEDTAFADVFPAGIRLKNSYDARQFFRKEDEFQISAHEAYNLLNGRAIYKENSWGKPLPAAVWVKLNMRQKDANGNNLFEQIFGSQKFELKQKLEFSLPPQFRTEQVMAALIEAFKQGARPELIVLDDKKREGRILITAVPEKNKIRLEFGDNIILGREQSLSLSLYGQPAQLVQFGINQGASLSANSELGNTKEALLSKEQQQSHAPESKGQGKKEDDLSSDPLKKRRRR